jgi:hypothetical protein
MVYYASACDPSMTNVNVLNSDKIKYNVPYLECRTPDDCE